MAVGTIVASMLGAVGSGIKAFFGFKAHQAETIQSALHVLGDVNVSNAQREQAIATIIAGEAQSGYWLAAVWRPLIMVSIFGLIIAFFFGVTPSNINGEMPPIIEQLFDLLKIGIMGYIPGRTLEKIIKDINIGRVLKTFVEKKLG